MNRITLAIIQPANHSIIYVLKLTHKYFRMKSLDELYDIVFVGAGLSTSYTLLHLISNLNKAPKKETKLRLCIIDKHEEFWTGIPYGSRSGNASLIITSLKEFIPTAEKYFFVEWLKKNFKRHFGNLEENKESLQQFWFKKMNT